MSSVVISGDTSGTVTLAAPAVSGTTTLTLPAITGTVLASNSATTLNSGASAMTLQTNGTTAVTIDTSQNVGIGTSSPSYKLSIQTALTGTTAGSNTLGSFYSNGSGYDSNIRFGDNTNSATMLGYLSGNMYMYTGGAERMRIDSSGNVLVTNPSGLGYGTGSGGTVTQATNKTTGVTLNKPVGQITTAADALGAGASAAFTVTNSVMSGTDVVIVNSQNINYSVRISDMAAGSFKITIKNESGGSLSQAVVIGFSIIKGAIS